MNWSLAVRRAWKLPVIWAAEDPKPAEITAQATVVQVVYVAVPLNGPRLPGPLAAKAITEGNQ